MILHRLDIALFLIIIGCKSLFLFVVCMSLMYSTLCYDKFSIRSQSRHFFLFTGKDTRPCRVSGYGRLTLLLLTIRTYTPHGYKIFILLNALLNKYVHISLAFLLQDKCTEIRSKGVACCAHITCKVVVIYRSDRQST